ncbi:hypothetical protein B5E42_08835 [Flavonifractor sp. An10]|nr:hypothetical protein B5E42_08835 [Flavonifractor sp. An10]
MSNGTVTANYQLRQREPRDNFLRTDFNQDLARINAAWRGFQGGFLLMHSLGTFPCMVPGPFTRSPSWKPFS